MKISMRSIQKLTELINGDLSEITPYKSGPNLVKFFNCIGFNDVYKQGFPSRSTYTQNNIIKLNNKNNAELVIKEFFNPIDYIENGALLTQMLEEFNKYLDYDGYQVTIENKKACIKSVEGVPVKIENHEKIGTDFAKEQVEKCENKIVSQDYDGAITNARSLMEDVIRDVYKMATGIALDSTGDLIKDYQKLKKELNLSENSEASMALKQITSGLTSIVNGLAAIRNKMSDGHSRTVKPRRHHAKLVVNSAKTFVDFLYDTLEYQKTEKNN